MFVQEEKIFAGKVLRLHICASDGTEWLEEATEDTSVEQLKERCLKQVRPAPRPRPPPPPLSQPRQRAERPPSRPRNFYGRRQGRPDTGASEGGRRGAGPDPSVVFTGVAAPRAGPQRPRKTGGGGLRPPRKAAPLARRPASWPAAGA